MEYTTFLDGQNMAQFWEYVKYFLFFVGPIVMIFFAVDIVGHVIRIIRKSVGSASEERKKDDDDIYYY